MREQSFTLIFFSLFALFCWKYDPTPSPLSQALTFVRSNRRLNVGVIGNNTNEIPTAFLRTDDTHVKATEKFPRIQSSQYTLTLVGSCFIVESFNSSWFEITSGNELRLTKLQSEATLFEFDEIEITENSKLVSLLRVCGKKQWVLSFAGQSHSQRSENSPREPLRFQFQPIGTVQGVNLGGWFIPEVWMNPSFYNGTGVGWGGSLCAVKEEHPALAEVRMLTHLQNWITESDFVEISSAGFNSIRLPIGYWNMIRDPYHRYAPSNLTVSIQHIDWAFKMAAKYELSVLIDLHGAPGSQNGQDHSGCGYSILGEVEWCNTTNIDLTLLTIEAIAQRYGGHPQLYGIELLNEPALSIEQMDHFTLARFYTSAYNIIRKYDDKALVIFNELYSSCYGWWGKVLMEPAYYNVVVDWHLYDGMGEAALETEAQHVNDAVDYAALISTYNNVHPVLIGEWSMSTGGATVTPSQVFVNECVASFDAQAVGWYLWTWKVERGAGYDVWDVQYQLQEEHGLRAINRV